MRDEEHESGGDSERETSDVREEGGAPSRLRLHEREPTRPQLQSDPDAEEPDRRDLADEDDPEEDQRQDPRAGEEDEVGAEDARDSATRADVRDARRVYAGEL